MSTSECSLSLPRYPELPSNQYDEAGPSDLGTNFHVPAIFLSHSGRQKPFVEHLYDALRSANYTPFFDQHSLPKASSFPANIERAAHGCKLGVIVLSDNFLTSKWPMLELQMLILERGNDPAVLPLFYKLRPGDLKSSTNLDKWRPVWKEKANNNASQWEKAVELLDKCNGEVFVEGTSETAYIKKVVQRITTIVACPVLYDLSSIQGQQRLTKEIARLFEHVQARGRCEELACMMGLHGVGGLGKTTLCMSMVNFYTSQYLGRSCLIEFPSDDNKLKIAQESKRALKVLTSLSNEFLSNVPDNFDQMYELALDGIIQLGSGKVGAANMGEIEVHDLYLDLARREIADSSRFLTKDSTRPMEEMEWKMLRRVVLRGDKASHFLERLRRRECRELQVLVATSMSIRTPVHVDCMPSLCVLKLEWHYSSFSVQERMGIMETIKNAVLIPASRDVVKLKGLDQLQVLDVSNSRLVRRIEGLHALRSLRRLDLSDLESLEKLGDLSGLTQLESLCVRYCSLVQRIEGLHALGRLRRLHLFELRGLENLEGLSGLIQLETLYVALCDSLEKLPDLSGLPRLQKLQVTCNLAMEEVEGLSSSLKEVDLCDFAVEKRLDMRGLDLRGLTCLERLTLWGKSEWEEELRGEYLCSNLKHLALHFNVCLPKHVTFDHLSLLQYLQIEECDSIEKLEVGYHPTLKTLGVNSCEALEEIGDFSALNCLQELQIGRCPRLTKLRGLADISFSTRLTHVHLSECESLDESSQIENRGTCRNYGKIARSIHPFPFWERGY